MINPLRPWPGLRAAGRVTVTVTALLAVSAAVAATHGPGDTRAVADDLAVPATSAPVAGRPVAAGTDNPGVQSAQASARDDRRAAVDASQAAEQARREAAAQAAAASRSAAAEAAAASLAARQRADQASRDARRDPRGAARLMLADHGWSQGQFGCLDALWAKESGWNPGARNASSGAFGIPQALPGGKMASAGADWQTNPVTQIRWGLQYIADVYGSPCAAWAHSRATNWY